MPLTTEVQNRYRTQFLIELTNPNDRGATTVNLAALQEASDDVEADLEVHAGTAYDNNDARHVSAAVRGVVKRLQVYQGKAPDRDITNWQQSLRDGLRLVTGNNRVRPRSSSNLTPAEEAPGGQIVRPFFDPETAFGDLIPGTIQADVTRPGGLQQGV